MCPPDLARARRLFEDALAQEPARRKLFLLETCGDDEELRNTVEQMLQYDSEADETRSTFLSPPLRLLPFEFEAGARFGNYQLERRIASGGMGTVYEAMQDQPRRKVAIKLLRTGAASPEALRRFQYESEFLGRLQHPSIAQVYEAGTHDGVPYFAMEYIQNGAPITQFAHEKHLTIRQIVALMADVCDAVHHGHQKGILHRDLKPGNILVDESGRVKIIDFGVARTLDHDPARESIETRAGQLVGTLQYMAPEQLAGGAMELDTRGDVYSLGIVIYELLAGKLPFSIAGLSLPEAVKRLSEVRVVRIRNVNTNIPGELEWIIQKSLEFERDRRYASASELARDLRNWLAGESVSASPPGAIYRLRVFVRKNRPVVAGASIAILALVAGVVLLWMGKTEAMEHRQIAEQKARQQEAMYQFVRDIFNMNDLADEDEDGPSLEQKLEAAITSLDRAFPGEPEIVASMRATIGAVYANLGLQNRAESQLRIAHEQLRRNRGDQDPETIRAGVQLGLTLLRNRKHREAANILRDYYESARAQLGDVERERIHLRALVSALQGGGPWADADAYSRKLFDSKSKVSDPTNYLFIRQKLNYAAFLATQERFQEAETMLAEMDNYLKTTEFANDRRRYDVLRIRGKNLMLADRMDEAKVIFDECFAGQARLNAQGVKLINFDVTKGEWLARQGKTAEGIALVRHAIEQLGKTRGKDGPSGILAIMALGRLLTIDGKLDEALVHLQKVADRAASYHGEFHPIALEALELLAGAHAETGNRAQAVEIYKSALAKVLEVGGAGCPRSISIAEKLKKLN